MPKISERASGAPGVVAEDPPCILHLVPGNQDAPVQVWPERVEAELEGRRDPEVPAGAAHAPEEFGLLGLARANEPAIGGHELDRRHVVDRQPEIPLQPADAATERQPRDAGVADDPTGHTSPWACAATSSSPRSAPPFTRATVSADRLRRLASGEVDDEAPFATLARGAVATAPDGELEVVVAREAERGRDLPGLGRTISAGRRSWTRSRAGAPRRTRHRRR